MKLLVKPFYGWGWFKADGSLMEVPPPFELEVTMLHSGQPSQRAVGQVPLSPNHPLAGLWICLTPRFFPNDACNLVAFAQEPNVSGESMGTRGPVLFTGFAFAFKISG
jgi:hypothetical protein